MGMDYIKIDMSTRHVNLHVAGEFWIFLIGTILLMLTFGTYLWWQHKQELAPKNAQRTNMGA